MNSVDDENERHNWHNFHVHFMITEDFFCRDAFWGGESCGARDTIHDWLDRRRVE